MNTFMLNLQDATNFTRTDNGALAHKTTKSAVYDLFALGGAFRRRSDEDCILLFKNALEEDESLALKCLFYLADCRGGQGERRFFRVCYKWLAKTYPEVAKRNLEKIPEYRRWDDVIYSLVDTPLENNALYFIKRQLTVDVQCKTPSLLAKWLPSENASSKETKRMGNIIRSYLKISHKEYRKILSELRTRINIVEKLMSANRWDEIEFDKIPSRAGLIYKNAFARRDIIKQRYEAFAKSEDTKVNASVLYPYEVVYKAVEGDCGWNYNFNKISDTDRAIIEKYWKNLPDYLNGKDCKMMCVVDTSGSMTGAEASAPINVAIGLGMYCAERIGGAFKDHYISFSAKPQLIKIEGVDFVDKVRRIYRTNLCQNTNIEATFKLLKNIALKSNPEDIPETIVIISDMQIDRMSHWRSDTVVATEMEKIRKEWEEEGLKCPKLVYWNVNAKNNTILDDGENVTYVSGMSPVIFEQVISGVTGYDLMLEKIESERYKDII